MFRIGLISADLLTVYLGIGIFTANASVDVRDIPAFGTGIMMNRQYERTGFLSEPQFGYGLACYVWLREESSPEWAEHLQRDPANLLDDVLRYLGHAAEPGHLPQRWRGAATYIRPPRSTISPP